MDEEIDYSFIVLEEMLTFKKYSSREEVIFVGKKMVEISASKPNISPKLKRAYAEAYKKLETLSYDEMNEIINILSSYDD